MNLIVLVNLCTNLSFQQSFGICASMMAMSMYLAANLASAEQESKKFLNEEVDAELAPVLKV